MVQRLKTHFSEEQIVELTLRATLCGFFNRFNEALGIEIEDGVIEDMLAAGGRDRGSPPSRVPDGGRRLSRPTLSAWSRPPGWA